MQTFSFFAKIKLGSILSIKNGKCTIGPLEGKLYLKFEKQFGIRHKEVSVKKREKDEVEGEVWSEGEHWV